MIVSGTAYDTGERPAYVAACCNFGSCRHHGIVLATDDGFAHTHDDAQSLIRYAVPGARVRFWKPDTSRGRSMSYEITVERYGERVAPVFGAYTLPCPAAQIANHARSQCAKWTNEKA